MYETVYWNKKDKLVDLFYLIMLPVIVDSNKYFVL